MAWIMQVITPENWVVVEAVTNNVDDSIYVEDAAVYGVPQQEWRKAGHLFNWVISNKPDWKVLWQEFDTAWLVNTIKESYDKAYLEK